MRPFEIQTRIVLVSLILLLTHSGATAAPDDVEKQPVRAQAQQQFFMDDANLDANIYNPHGNAKTARARLDSKLQLQLDELDRICELSETQKRKLMLAASSDMKRFFDEIDAVRKKYRGGNQDQQAWNQFWQDIQPLQLKMSQGVFDAGSFYAKTIRKTLSEEQVKKYDELVGDRRRFRYRAAIEVAMTAIENSVPLRSDQHEAIVKLLLEETRPPASFGQYDQNLIKYRLGGLPQDKLKSLLEERQWQQMQNQINQARGMEQFLIQNGLIPQEEVDANRPKVARVRRQIIKGGAAPADATRPENRK